MSEAEAGAPEAPEFPKTYDPGPAEARWYGEWEQAGAFAPEVNPDGEPFCIVIPPPNVTGSLHMGHAFEHALIDATVRRKRMQGYAALWLPGTDHAGIATQNVVERELAKEGIDRHELGRASFVERVWQWKEESGGRITQQMRRMGNSCDWGRERFTMDEGLSQAVRTVFVFLYEEELMYRANRIINWCPRCHTALSDIEVEHEELDGELAHFRYELADGSGSVTVATTRAETMLGDTAVAVHPNDFEIAQRHDLPAIDIFDESAVVNAQGGRFAGQDRFDARRAVKEALEAEGFLDRVDDHQHSVGHCYRCHTVVEPRLSLQWFVKVAPLAAPAVEAVRDDRTQFIPERWEKLYFDWLENLRDWCVSRQIWWGHRIPAWYCPDGHVTVAMETPGACAECGSSEIEQDSDVLDTWFSSALWPFSTLGWPEQTDDLARFYPNAVLHTGFDIIYFWVARMMQMGLHFAGDVPFREVAIHGLVRDADGRKMSKSFGNVVDPLELADRYGADALRFALTRAASPGQDVPLAEEWVEGARNFLNKLWNSARFTHANLDGRPIADFAPPSGELRLADRWIRSRLHRVIETVNSGFERYDFAEAVRELQAFTWGEFCDWYIEVSKLPLAAGEESRATTQEVLAQVLGSIVRLLHPVAPYATEELWHRLGGDGLIVVADWPNHDDLPIDEGAEVAMATVIEVVSVLRRFRSEHGIAPSKRFRAFVVPADAAQRATLEGAVAEIETLAGLEALVFEDERPPGPGEQRMVAAGAELAVPMEGLIDVSAALDQLDRQLGKLGADLAKVSAKLGNAKFVDNAPAEVVDEQRAKQAQLEEAVEALRAQRAVFEGS